MECARCGDPVEYGLCANPSCPTALSGGRNTCSGCGASNAIKDGHWLCSAERCPWSSPPPDIRKRDRVALHGNPAFGGTVTEIQTPSQMLKRHGRQDSSGLCFVEWDNGYKGWYCPQSLLVTRAAVRGWRGLVRRIRRLDS